MKKHIITISDKQLRKLNTVMEAYIESSRRLQAGLDKTIAGIDEFVQQSAEARKRREMYGYSKQHSVQTQSTS